MHHGFTIRLGGSLTRDGEDGEDGRVTVLNPFNCALPLMIHPFSSSHQMLIEEQMSVACAKAADAFAAESAFMPSPRPFHVACDAGVKQQSTQQLSARCVNWEIKRRELRVRLVIDGVAEPHHIVLGSVEHIDEKMHGDFLAAVEHAFPIGDGTTFTCFPPTQGAGNGARPRVVDADVASTGHAFSPRAKPAKAKAARGRAGAASTRMDVEMGRRQGTIAKPNKNQKKNKHRGKGKGQQTRAGHGGRGRNRTWVRGDLPQ